MRRGSLQLGLGNFGMKRRAETPVSGEMTTSLDLTPVRGSSEGGT